MEIAWLLSGIEGLKIASYLHEMRVEALDYGDCLVALGNRWIDNYKLSTRNACRGSRLWRLFGYALE